MAFPVIAGTNSGNSGANATSHVVNLPDNIATGDLLIALICVDGQPTLTWPVAPAWTSLATGVQTVIRTQIRYRRVDGSEGWGASGNSITITSSANEGSAHASYRITGSNATTAPEAAAVTEPPVASSYNSDALNPANWGTEDTLWIAAVGWDGQRSHSSYPANYSSGQVTNRWANSNGTGVAMSARSLNAASEDPGAGTLSQSCSWDAFTIAVRPVAGYSATLTGGTYSLSGASSDLVASRAVTMTAGAYAITGTTASVLVGRALEADAGAYAVAGSEATETAHRSITLTAGSYSLTGTDIGGTFTQELVANSGSYAITGTEITAVAHRELIAVAGSYAVSGASAALVSQHSLIATPGSYAITGSAVYDISKIMRLTATPGSYVLTGAPADLLASRILLANPGAYILSGSFAHLQQYPIHPVGILTQPRWGIFGQRSKLTPSTTGFQRRVGHSFSLVGQGGRAS